MNVVLQHIIISDKDSSPELVMDAQSSAGEITEDVRSFCDVFSLPLSERPLPGFHLFTVVSAEIGIVKFVIQGKRTLSQSQHIKFVFANFAN